MYSEPTVENGTCKRCVRRGRILSNGYCTRCDDVIFGRPIQTERIYPIFPEIKHKYSKRKIYWCKE
jgi:hypothetical protein